MFQRVRELEAKLEIQKRHLKELEEKVGGEPRASPPPAPPGLLAGTGHRGVWSFCAASFVTPRTDSAPRLPSLPPSPHDGHIHKISSFFSCLSREEKCSLGPTFCVGGVGVRCLFSPHRRPFGVAVTLSGAISQAWLCPTDPFSSDDFSVPKPSCVF